MLANDLRNALSRVDGLPKELIGYIVDDVLTSLSAYCEVGESAWNGLQESAQKLRSYFVSPTGKLDLTFTYEELAGTGS